MLKAKKMVFRFLKEASLKNFWAAKGRDWRRFPAGAAGAPGFIITTAACRKYFESGNRIWRVGT